MIQSVLLGLWSCIVALGAAYAGFQWGLPPHTDRPAIAEPARKRTHVRVRPISVPITRDGAVSGYVIANFSYVADAEKLKNAAIKPDVFLFDSLLTEVVTRKHFDYSSMDSNGLSQLATHVKNTVNSRLGMPIISDIIAEGVDFVPIEEVRGRGIYPTRRKIKNGKIGGGHD